MGLAWRQEHVRRIQVGVGDATAGLISELTGTEVRCRGHHRWFDARDSDGKIVDLAGGILAIVQTFTMYVSNTDGRSVTFLP